MANGALARKRGYDELSETEKVAVMCLAVGQDRTRQIFDQLEPEEVRKISHAMAALGSITPGVVEQVLKDFAALAEGDGSVIGDPIMTRQFLEGILPEDRVETLMAELQGPGGDTIWQKLSNIPDSQLHGFLSHQHPQTVAVVLSAMDPTKAGRVLNMFPENEAYMIALRISHMESIDEANREKLEHVLQKELAAEQAWRSRQEDGTQTLAKILNRTRRSRVDEILTYMEDYDARTARKVRGNMFTFDDLLGLETVAIRKIAGRSDSEDLAKALATADERTRERFFENMSERGARALKRQLEEIGRVRRSEVERARMRLIEIARNLESQGEIALTGDDAPEEDEI